jgi:PilZ domain-containing protein
MEAKTLIRRGDERKSRRHPMRRAALVLYADGQTGPCVIWDMSDGGARLAIARPTAGLPQRFTLLLKRDGSVTRTCEVIWTDTRYVGVRFIV